jgi:integrase
MSKEGEAALRAAIERVATSKSANTLRGYRTDWSIWCAAAVELGVPALPATPEALGAFVSWLRDGRGCTATTIRRRLAGVAWVHHLAGKPIDTRHVLIAGAVAGVSNESGPQRQAAAITLADLKRMLAVVGAGLQGERNRALLLLGWAGAFRRSELVSLRADVPSAGEKPWNYVRLTPEGLVARLVRSKADQDRMVEVGIPRGKNRETCPVRAVEDWLRSSGIRFGPLFPAISLKGHIEHGHMSGEAVRKIVRTIADRAGIESTALDSVSAHSLRAGFVTEAYKSGLDDESIMAHSRHRDLRTMRRYVRRAKVVTGSAAGKVGL